VRTNLIRHSRRAFTLIEVLAALLLMAIVIPVAMQGMSVASRAGLLGQRKAAAMRVAERMINELIVTGGMNQTSSSGTAVDGDTSYPWTMQSEPWTEDSMTHVTFKVTFSIQSNSYDVSASTLFDATAGSAASVGTPSL
jgi:prepilin-type N-terminal cleavage/methylation domain-containing protein